METEQACSEGAEKDQQSKVSSKRNQKKKSTAGNQDQTNTGALAKNNKLQKSKSGTVSVPKQGTKGPSANLAAKKNKDKTESNKNIHKGGDSKDEPKKQNRKKNKKSADLTQLSHSATLIGKNNCLIQSTGNIITEADNREGSLDQEDECLSASQSHSGLKEDKQSVLIEEIVPKPGSELSKSKKRRIRKKRLLESLGITIINSVKSAKDKSVAKKRKKKKKSKLSSNPEIVTEESLREDNTTVKSLNANNEINGFLTSRNKEICCDVGKKGAVRKSEDNVSFTSKLKCVGNSHSKKTPEQTKVKETKLEKKIFVDTLSEVKETNIVPDSNSAVKVCSSCEELQFKRQEKESVLSDNKTSLEDISVQFLGKKEEPSSSGKVDLVNFLSHDNVEGLFRSALLNDVTLSSRCSEKEVKNFFNTYGTFSERGRTQFAAVEKLLHSNTKDSEDIATSQYFEPALDKEISPTVTSQNSTAIVNNEPSLDSGISAISSQKCEYFSSKLIKDNINSDEPISTSSVENLETESSYNRVVKGLNRKDAVGNSLVLKGGLCRGPIYTSPNLENRITSSTNSNQIFNSESRVFVPNTHESCDANEQAKFDTCEVPEVGRLEPELVDVDNDLLSFHDKVKEHFLPGDNAQLTKVCDEFESNLTKVNPVCSVSTGLENSTKEKVFGSVKNAEVNTVECQVGFVHINEVTEHGNTKEKVTTESHFTANACCPKKQVSTCTGQTFVNSEKFPEKVQKISDLEKPRCTEFLSESGGTNQDTDFECNKTLGNEISTQVDETSQKSDILEVSFVDHNCNTKNELLLTDCQVDASKKEQEVKSHSSFPLCSSVPSALGSEIVHTSSTSFPQNKLIMKTAQGKTVGSSNALKPEKNREEVLAVREAKKAEKLARSKNKGLPVPIVPSKSTAETVPTTKSTSSPTKSKQLPKATVDSGKNKTEHHSEDIKLSESSIKNTAKISEVETLPSPLRETGNQKLKNEKRMPVGGAEGVEKIVELAEPQNKTLISGLKGAEANKSKEVLGEKTTETVVAKSDVQQPTTVISTKSKAELKAERRAKQEQQRALKAAQQQGKNSQGKSSAATTLANSKEQQPKKDTGNEVSKKTLKTTVQSTKPKTPEHRVKLFNHLYHERGPLTITESLMLYGPDLHPAVVKLGMQYADRVVVGSNARCIALLDALKQVIKDYETPPQKEFSRGIEAELQPSVAYLDCCRQLSVSMTNALRHLMWQLTQLPNSVSDSEAKKKLLEAIDTYIREQIEVAAQAICITVQRKIANGDVILTYGCSSLLQRILLEAHRSGTKFKVVIVDGRPWREGQEMLRRLVECGLDCSYVLVSAASFIMREVTKVFLGAHALLANGYVMSRAGSSQVALLAHSYNVPVLVCCETHKFCERVQTDSFVYNELGNPDDLVPTDTSLKESPLSKWRSIGSLTPLNLTYDVTPPDLVTAVVTELAILPCTSVPVILRIKPTETGC